MYVEVAWVLVSLGTQVQPHVILDPDYLFVSYETIIWIMIYEQYGLSDNNLQNIVNKWILSSPMLPGYYKQRNV